MVVAIPVETMNAFMVECEFITGSNARGCMVVLKGAYGDETTRLMRDITMSNTDPRVIINVKHLPSCYQEVEAYDIESDGSTGSLPVPGTLMRNFNTKIPCTSKSKLSVKCSVLRGLCLCLD